MRLQETGQNCIRSSTILIFAKYDYDGEIGHRITRGRYVARLGKMGDAY
jgi:hypothetical protein